MTIYQKAVDLTNLLLSINEDIIRRVRKMKPTISKLASEHCLQVKDGIFEDLLSKLYVRFKR